MVVDTNSPRHPQDTFCEGQGHASIDKVNCLPAHKLVSPPVTALRMFVFFPSSIAKKWTFASSMYSQTRRRIICRRGFKSSSEIVSRRISSSARKGAVHSRDLCLWIGAGIAAVGFELAINWLYTHAFQRPAASSTRRFLLISLGVIILTSLLTGLALEFIFS
jgi:hypothetical protein